MRIRDRIRVALPESVDALGAKPVGRPHPALTQSHILHALHQLEVDHQACPLRLVVKGRRDLIDGRDAEHVVSLPGQSTSMGFRLE